MKATDLREVSGYICVHPLFPVLSMAWLRTLPPENHSEYTINMSHPGLRVLYLKIVSDIKRSGY